MESRDDALLSARLAALPLESPPADAWPQLARRLQAPPRRTRGLPAARIICR